MHSSEDFYTKFAASYEAYASGKKNYLTSVDTFIIENAGHARSIVDVGAGNGKRGKKIAGMLGVKSLTLIDSSDGMLGFMRNVHGANIIKADISSEKFKPDTTYDVALCLWNVLGHISNQSRSIALKNLASLVKNNGLIFLDVNNRYNIAHYGLRAGFRNILKDIFLPNISNGDFPLTINTDTGSIDTSVHIFSPFEIRRLIKSAGLTIEKVCTIDYRTGIKMNNPFSGQLVYKLKKS